MSTAYEFHPLCTLFPRMAEGDFDCLCKDIEANGLRQPIVTHEGMILDGGNRYRACLETGTAPTFKEFDGGSVVAFVLSANLHRRHLSPGQQAAIVASCADWSAVQKHGGNRKQDQAAALPLETVADRALQSGASDRTQRMADKVAKSSPELAAQVAHGDISLAKAVESISPKKQKEPDPDFVVGYEAEEKKQAAAPAQQNSEEADALREQLAELSQNLTDTIADNESMARVWESDDKIVASLAEAKQYREQVRILETRINGLLNEKNEAIRAAKSWQRKFEKLEKEQQARTPEDVF